jgi:hypothetical protein
MRKLLSAAAIAVVCVTAGPAVASASGWRRCPINGVGWSEGRVNLIATGMDAHNVTCNQASTVAVEGLLAYYQHGWYTRSFKIPTNYRPAFPDGTTWSMLLEHLPSGGGSPLVKGEFWRGPTPTSPYVLPRQAVELDFIVEN